jgi:hypothetical protein
VGCVLVLADRADLVGGRTAIGARASAAEESVAMSALTSAPAESMAFFALASSLDVAAASAASRAPFFRSMRAA